MRRLTEPGLHFVGGATGLALQVTATGARSWVLRMMVGGKRREMGLGSFADVPLAEARERARAARAKVREGIDPIAEAQAARSKLAAAQAAMLTFQQCAERFIASKRGEWKNAKHAQQFENTLVAYAYPVVGRLAVGDVTLSHVMAILEPIWATKTETATRLRGRIEQVLAWAAVRGLRSTDNPARWRGHLDKLLPAPTKVARVEHHPALAVAEVGAFMQRLRDQRGMGAMALQFAILTAARSGEVRGATWAEIDLEARLWVIPATRMKAGKEHRVPLSDAALAVLKAAPRFAESNLLFTSATGGELSDMSLTAVLRRMGVPAVPHGFRSTFRDWAAERTSYPSDMAEMALAHAIGDKVEAAYRRGDMVDKRRRMMSDWAEFLARPQVSGAVVEFKRA